MKVTDTKSFIKKAQSVHGDRYDYSKVNYVNAKTKVTIICKEHGEFEQLPNAHYRGQNCPICSGAGKTNREGFIKKAKLRHGNKFDYSLVDYKNNYTKVKIICPVHGEYECTPKSHLKNDTGSCAKCARENEHSNNEEFIKRAKEVHGDKYDYSKVNYTKRQNKVTIICPIHGEFEQRASDHHAGKGCQICGRLQAGHKHKVMNHKQVSKLEYMIYLLKFESEDETFIKVGVTTNLKNRLKQFSAYNVTTLDTFITNAEDALDYEKHIQESLKEYHYLPKKKFGGYTECFDYNLTNLKDYII